MFEAKQCYCYRELSKVSRILGFLSMSYCWSSVVLISCVAELSSLFSPSFHFDHQEASSTPPGSHWSGIRRKVRKKTYWYELVSAEQLSILHVFLPTPNYNVHLALSMTPPPVPPRPFLLLGRPLKNPDSHF